MQKMTKRIATWGAGVGLALAPIVAFAQRSAKEVVNEGLNVLTVSGLGTKDIRETIASIINVFMGLLGTVAIVIILIGGFQWMTAGGNEEKVEKAKQLLGAGVIGLAIILAAYSITRFVIGSLINAT